MRHDADAQADLAQRSGGMQRHRLGRRERAGALVCRAKTPEQAAPAQCAAHLETATHQRTDACKAAAMAPDGVTQESGKCGQ